MFKVSLTSKPVKYWILLVSNLYRHDSLVVYHEKRNEALRPTTDLISLVWLRLFSRKSKHIFMCSHFTRIS